MDLEKQKRLQSLKVIASEAVMVVAAIIIVVVLGFLASGYWINSDFKVDRQGLLQLSSLPSGATVTIDGVTGAWYERTNMSKNLTSGEHIIEITRDGYDTWTKTINVSEGLLYRLHYPRLFLNDRTRESLFETPEGALATVSADHNSLLLITPTDTWQLIDLNNETVRPVELSYEKLFTAPFAGSIETIRWDRDGSHVLLKTRLEDHIEWALLDIEDPTRSVNITKEFGADFSDIQILDNNSNNFLVVQNGNLHKIDLSARSISSVLVPNITAFDYFNENEVVFTAANPDAANASADDTEAPQSDPYYIGTFKIGDSEITRLMTLPQPALVTLSKFYEDKYITVLAGDQLTVYKKEDFESVAEFTLGFAPASLKVGHNGEFIIMADGSHLATLDMEPMQVRDWTIENTAYDWLDNDMLYVVQDGELITYDFDGLNRRVLASNTQSLPAAITDDKWLYYFSDGHLVREWLVQR